MDSKFGCNIGTSLRSIILEIFRGSLLLEVYLMLVKARGTAAAAARQTHYDSTCCRERKRQKALETENTATLLATKVKDFERVKERYNQLNAQNDALQHEVAKAEAELNQLRMQQEKGEVRWTQCIICPRDAVNLAEESACTHI